MGQEAGHTQNGVQFIYNIFFEACFILSAPYYFLRMKRRGGWRHGFGGGMGGMGMNPMMGGGMGGMGGGMYRYRRGSRAQQVAPQPQNLQNRYRSFNFRRR